MLTNSQRYCMKQNKQWSCIVLTLASSCGACLSGISICYTMPTRGVSRIHEAITINPEGVA